MYEDKDPWPFRCPQCGNEFTEEIGRLKANPRTLRLGAPESAASSVPSDAASQSGTVQNNFV